MVQNCSPFSEADITRAPLRTKAVRVARILARTSRWISDEIFGEILRLQWIAPGFMFFLTVF